MTLPQTRASVGVGRRRTGRRRRRGRRRAPVILLA
jgi:hypothetical protein